MSYFALTSQPPLLHVNGKKANIYWLRCWGKLPAVVCKSFVCLRHLVCIFTLLDGLSSTIVCIDELCSHFFSCGISWSASFVGIKNQPSKSKSNTTIFTNFYRNLVCCSTNTTRFYFEVWLGVFPM